MYFSSRVIISNGLTNSASNQKSVKKCLKSCSGGNGSELRVVMILSYYASANSSCAQPPSPPPPPGHYNFFLLLWGLLSCQIPRGGDEKRGQIPRPPSTLQHFSLIAQSSSAILSILMCDFFVSTNVFLCNDSAILIETSGRDHTSLWF